MASSGSSHLTDIDEKFCQCPICLQQYREPKQLPCLHRYCSDCLKQLMERNQGVTVISCPQCRDEVTVPTEGVDGFKTDFYMKNIIEYIQLQKSLEDESSRECYSCSKKLKVTSYCFKCTGFLCKECYEFHIISKSLKEHKQHVLSLKDLKSKHMTLEKLADLKEAPRCQSHLNDSCLLCCRTCNELPICVTCVHGRHKNHDINDVAIIAAEEREKLQHEIKILNQYKERMMRKPQEVETVKGNIAFYFRQRKEKFTTRYEKDTQNVKKDIERIEEDFKRSQTEIANNKERELTETKKQIDEEMKQIKIKYDNMFGVIEKKNRIKLDNLKEEKEGKVENKRAKLATLENVFQYSMDTLVQEQEKGLTKLADISQQVAGIIGRYENLTATGHNVLKTRSDWTAVQCIPDICKAIEPLTEDMKGEFPELKTLSRAWFTPEITENEGSPLKIEGMNNVCEISGITSYGDNSIVITGCVRAGFKSHITIINMNGKILRHEKLEGKQQIPNVRHCAYLSEFKIATVCRRDEIGILDVRDCIYTKKNISDVISSWSVGRIATCVCTDLVNNRILVGGFKSRDVYVFDDQLNYHHTLTLPEEINHPHDMNFSNGDLLVCDWAGKETYVVSVKGQEGNVILKFKKPNFDKDNASPLSVCKDGNNFIYILWMTGNSFSVGRRVVTQYTRDGRHLLTTKGIEVNDARCVTTLNIGNTAKLLVATLKSRKIFVYRIT